MKAELFDFYKRKYEEIDVPDGAVLVADIDDVVRCAQCGRPVRYAESFTSSMITDAGLGYAVCSDCYEDEQSRRLSAAEVNRRKEKYL